MTILKRMMAVITAMAVCMSFGAVVFADESVAIMLEDFENYFSNGDMISNAFESGIWSEKNLKTTCELISEGGNNDTQAMQITTRFLPEVELSVPGNMYSFAFPVAPGKGNWSKAKYIMLWAKNDNPVTYSIKPIIKTTYDSTSYLLGSAKKYFEVENRPGEGVFKDILSNGGDRVFIPANFEGYIRWPLSHYADLKDLTGIKAITFGMSGSRDIEEGTIVLDDVCVVDENYKIPVTKMYLPEITNPFVNMNYQTMQVRFTATIQGLNKTDITVKIQSPGGKTVSEEVVTYGEDGKINYYYQLPDNAEKGKYILSAYPSGASGDEIKQYGFAYFGAREAAFTDTKAIDEERSIEILSKLGIITGYQDGSFKPDNDVTRAEFSALMVRLLGIEGEKSSGTVPFEDVGGHWSENNIALAAERGIINGYGDGRFGPDDKVTYEQAVKMLVAALGYDKAAADAGGYPAGYITVAKDVGVTMKKDKLGILREMTSSDNKATRAVVAQLLANAVKAETAIDGAPTSSNLLTEVFEDKMDALRYETVREYGDNILTYAVDNFGVQSSPVFISGINPYTYEPFIWLWNDQVMLPANFTYTQNVMRTLVSLSEVSGDLKYKKAAADQINYYFENLTDNQGLLYAGGHWWQDAFADSQNGETRVMEFKAVYPYYEFMYEVNPQATAQYLKAIWNSLMHNWQTLETTRHGTFDKAMGALWDSKYEVRPPLSESGTLTFQNAASDIIYAGAMYTKLTGETKSYDWSELIYEQFVKSRHPATRLPASQFTQAKKNRDVPPEIAENGNASLFTTTYGDRAKYQFGPEWGDVALEAWMLSANSVNATTIPMVYLNIYQQLGGQAKNFLDWTIPAMSDYVTYAYNEADNTVSNVWANGEKLDGFELQRNGYYGQKGSVFKPAKADNVIFPVYARGYGLSGESELWRIVRGIGKANDLGDIGISSGISVNVNYATTCNDPEIMFGVMDIYESTGQEAYLKLAKSIGNNIVFDNFVNGFNMKPNGIAARYLSRLDEVDPFALITLHSIIEGKRDKVPNYNGGSGTVEGPYTNVNNDATWDEPFFRGSIKQEY